MRRRKTQLIAVFTCLWFSLPAIADIIRFQDGTEMRGKVIKKTEQEMVIQFDFGTMTFQPGEIRSIEEEKDVPMPAGGGEASAPAAAPVSVSKKESPPLPAKPAPAASKSQPAEELSLPEAMQAVAFIKVLRKDGQPALGSGAIINASGTIVTNHHVVEDARQISVILFTPEQKSATAREFEARVVKSSPYYDLAVIDIHADTPHYFRFGDDSSVRIGEDVRAIGNPMGLQVTISKGIISGARNNKGLGIPYKTMEGDYLSVRAFEDITWIQTDASINPGNSGGPLLNGKNEIIGINTFGYQMAGDAGLNFALHVRHVRPFAAGYAGS